MKYNRKTIEKWKFQTFIIISFIAGMLMTGLCLWITDKVYAQQEFISPLSESDWAVWTVEKEVEKPVMYSNVLDIVDAIWLLESSRGKAGIGLQRICENKGMWNELGYGGMHLKHCFRNENEGRGRVALWILEKLQRFNGDIRTTACFYNLGTETSRCEYADKLMDEISKNAE